MEKQSGEDSFKNAFQEAQMRPSSEVWTHIELDLEKEEGNSLKKRVVFYRWMAAASVMIAVSLLGVGYFQDTTQENSIALNQPAVESIEKIAKNYEMPKEEVPAEVNPAVSEVNSITAQATTNDVSGANERARTTSRQHVPARDKNYNTPSNRDGIISNNSVVPDVHAETNKPIPQSALNTPKYAKRGKSPLPPLVVQRPYQIHFPKTEPDQIDLLLAEIEMEEKAVKKNRSDKKETFWTSVAMAAGTYNPITTSSSSGSSSFYAMDGAGSLDGAQVVNLSNQVEASGYSFSSGISLGGKVSDRWVLQAGVNYLTQNSTYSSNAVLVDGANNFKLASLNTLKSESYSGFQTSNPYTVNSTLKYFNIPLQAGYRIINKDFGWQMQGGISTDFFLQNTLSAEAAGLDRVSQSGGDESPYRTVNFSGLLGTEVSYRFGEHYRIALNPGLRYPLQSVYKSESGISATPITFDVGVKFHYIFR